MTRSLSNAVKWFCMSFAGNRYDVRVTSQSFFIYISFSVLSVIELSDYHCASVLKHLADFFLSNRVSKSNAQLFTLLYPTQRVAGDIILLTRPSVNQSVRQSWLFGFFCCCCCVFCFCSLSAQLL